MELFENKRKTVIILRWLLIIALSYLILYKQRGTIVASGENATFLFDFLVLSYVGSNILLFFLPKPIFEQTWFDPLLVVIDTALVSGAIFLVNNTSSYLMFFYFLIVLMTTFGQGFKGIVANGFLLIGMYILFQVKEIGIIRFISDPGDLLPIPFLMVAVIFYGLLVDQENRRHKKTLEAIQEVSETISSTLNLREVYKTILDTLVNLLRAEKCSIMLLDRDGRTLTIQDARGMSEEIILTTKIKLGEGIAGWVARQETPLLLDSPPLTAPDGSSFEATSDIRSAIAVPLKIKNRVTGVITASNSRRSRPYGRQDLNMLAHFASEAATAIENARLFEQIEVNRREIKAAHFDSIMAFAGSLESKDIYTGGHAQRLSIYSEMIAERLELPKEEIERLKFAAILHDVGKISIPDRVLHSTGKLSPEEWEIMKTHSEKGAVMIHQIPSLSQLSRYIRHHHERWDGKGYPDKIKGEEIHLYSRIIAVCDTYDAITTNRSYQTAYPPERVIQILRECRGTQLDPELIDIFMGIVVKSDGLFTLTVTRKDSPGLSTPSRPVEPKLVPLRRTA